ncbi:pantetheine-phosphate adenylyltransferase [Acetobacter sp.]|uniref:pantetheine-phosphate adenylyltransferase n=1 Tax=Acetobacter sp. TaxID=440 RepID=UPI0025C7293A|nr:pantetheine-phosphate adenylyltransferase [Acetobacter sp.]MCH4092185.1 pantetheine-phosphate adenylyltransferase [Acetobacter sp.]MCI1299898.1 pantetheine-phosphate adenylyltransferase [Acetobacter sp.]MCI1315916.1 pantetheine-phosphate adenylyltransferase [Acetobacter sp.]
MKTERPARVGFYPGTFDPVTFGHLDVIERAARLVDRLVIGVAVNAGKNPLLPIDERVISIQEAIPPLAERTDCEIEVVAFNELLVDAVRRSGATMIVRGLRLLVDFDYEAQMLGANRRLAPEIETIFLMASERTQFVSSRMVREIANYGGDIREFTPPGAAERVTVRLGR